MFCFLCGAYSLGLLVLFYPSKISNGQPRFLHIAGHVRPESVPSVQSIRIQRQNWGEVYLWGRYKGDFERVWFEREKKKQLAASLGSNTNYNRPSTDWNKLDKSFPGNKNESVIYWQYLMSPESKCQSQFSEVCKRSDQSSLK